MRKKLKKAINFIFILIFFQLFVSANQGKTFLVIETEKKDCKVYINNGFAGKTGDGGLIIPLTPGTHLIKIKSFFYKSFEKEIITNNLSQRLLFKPEKKVLFTIPFFLFLLVASLLTIKGRHYFIKKSDKYFGNFHLKEIIGKGGVATIHRAYDKIGKREVALKIMDSDKISDKDLTEKFLREGKVISIIKEKYPDADIVEVFEFGNMEGSDNIPFISMKYIKGEPLLEVIKRRGKLTEQIAINIILQIAYTLEYCHNSGIYHRDLSPDNIIIEEDTSKLILIDFGIAKNEFTSYKTLDGSISGKPVYMSPEQCTGEEITSATDIYTLGILFYLLLEGNPPFTGSNPIEIINKHINSNIPEFSIDINKNIKNLIKKMTKKEPGKRVSLNDIIITLIGLSKSKELVIDEAIAVLTGK
ncbi:MAG: serine/threonine-protein kinase [Acidobacteriota bacterium]